MELEVHASTSGHLLLHSTKLAHTQCTFVNRPFQVPSFVGNRYFCDTGNHGTMHNDSAVYLNDPLWDGEGCGPNSTCCKFNNPPCTTLPQPTTDDMELRICCNAFCSINEDIIVHLVDSVGDIVLVGVEYFRTSKALIMFRHNYVQTQAARVLIVLNTIIITIVHVWNILDITSN